MRRIVLLFLLSVVVLAAKAQERATVKATVLDSLTNQPIALATVSVLSLKDSSLVSYTVTDKNGEFTLRNLRREPSRLLVSHVGYQNLHIRLKFSKGEVTDLGKLLLSSKMLQEVTIKGERVPVLIKKDTIEFDAEAFKTRPNALVEDLLKKLPGVQVDQSGMITVNGIDVSKIKVNGKTFFANDPTIATRNLEANMISKVQVYDDRDDDPDHLVPQYQVKKILNLKFKKKFAKGFLASIGAGGGTQDKYVASGFAAKFQDELQLSVKLNSDNISTTGNFSGNYGGFSTFTFENPGRETITSGNVDYTEDITKKLKLHIEYRGSNRVSNNTTDSRVQQNISDTIFNTITESMQRIHDNDQNFHAELEYKPDSLTIIRYVPDMENEDQTTLGSSSNIKSNTYFPLLNTELTSDNGSNSSFQYRHNLSYYRKVGKKGASITFSNSFNIQPQNNHDLNTDNLLSFVASLPSDTLARSSKNVSNDISAGLNVAYHYPLTKKLSADIVLTSLHDQNSGNLVTYDENFKTGQYNIFVADQSSDLVRGLWGQGLNPQLTYNFTDNFSMKAGLTALAQQIDNHFSSTINDLNQNFVYLLPSAEIHLKDFTLSYAESVQQPSISSLQPITIIYSPLYTFIGNPELKPTYLHNISLEFRKYDNASGIQAYFNTHLVLEKNSVVNEQTINAEGANVTTPVNRNGRFTTYFNGSFSKTFKKKDKWEVNANVNINGGIGHYFFIMNQQNGFQNTQYVTIKPLLYIQWNDLISIEPSYHVNYATTQYQLVNYPTDRLTTQGAGIAADVSLPESFRWRASYDYSYNPIVSPGFQQRSNLLNFSVTKRIQKGGKGEIGLICYDLLNQNVNETHFVVANTVNDVQNEVLKRYLLLTYTYHFNKFK
jgi:Outer membrane protein beta-barrel family/CarboxypepD_reg-like domain